MAVIPPTLNGFSATSVRLSIPWRGVWVAEIELAPDLVETVAPILGASTPAVLIVGDRSLIGTIDPRGSGVFGTKAFARVVGGRGGWDKSVPAQHFANPSGTLLSTVVYAATAALVGEVVLDPLPVLYGENYARTKGAASQIFGDRDWFVEPTTGIATVTPWPPIPLDITSATIEDFDHIQQKANIYSDTLLLPGTILIDTRFGAKTYTVRDVEQVFDSNGSHVEAWCSTNAVSRLTEAFANAVKEFAGTAHLKTYRYRFILPVGGKLALQAISPGAPNLNPIEQWTGLSGIKAALGGVAALTPATEIIVGFAGGDPSQPYLAAFSPLAKPLGITLDAASFVHVGIPTSPVALSAPLIIALQALATAIAAVNTGAGNVAAGAIATMQTAIAAASTATPSKKLFSE